MDVFLATDRLRLRRFTETDLDALVDLDGDPEVMRYITGGEPTPREVLRDEVLPAWLAYYERYPAYGFWAAHDRAGEFLGWFHFRPREGCPELGYRLRRSAWGLGYATEGSVALLRMGFADLGVDRVFAETMAVNTRSRRVMERAGLHHVRTFHQDWPQSIPGDEHGDVEYAATREEWLSRP